VTQTWAARTYQGMNALDEVATWRRAVAGDSDAFGRLFDSHSGRVYRHALRLTGDVYDAEEVLASAFLELWRRRDSVRVVDDSLLPWLLVTAGNLALNQRRGLRRYRAFLARLPHSEPHVDAAEAQALLRADLDVDPALLAAIRALNKTEQQLLALVALEDYPLRAAAAALGMTEQAARSRWQRIRRRLAQHHTSNTLALVVEH
jgi:RNA polymerase sigma factor (sigma-70 family)